MLHSAKYHLLGSTSLVLILAASSHLTFAEPARNIVTSNSDTSATNYGRAGGQTLLSTEPTQLPQDLTNAYEKTKASAERAYESSKQFVVESAQGRPRAAQLDPPEQGESGARKSVTSGAAIGAFGRAGIRDYWSTAQPSKPPQVLSNAYEETKGFVNRAYEKTSEFLTQSSQRPNTEQPSSLSGS